MERTIAYLTDLKDLSGLLAGARIEQAELVPAMGSCSLELQLTRAMLEQPAAPRAGLFKRAKTPWSASRLTLKRIHSVTIHRAEDLTADTPLLDAEAVPGGYQVTIQSPDGLQFVLQADQLQGEFADIGSPVVAP